MKKDWKDKLVEIKAFFDAKVHVPTLEEVRELYIVAAQSCRIDPDRVKIENPSLDEFIVVLQGGTKDELERFDAAAAQLFKSGGPT